MLRRILMLLMLSATQAWASGNGMPQNTPEVDPELLDSIRQMIKSNPYSGTMQDRARESAAFVQSPEYKRKMELMKQQIFPDYKPKDSDALAIDDGQRLYVFVSSSMPDHVVRRYAAQIEGLPGASLVMRGFIGGATKIKPTLRYRNRILMVDPECKSVTCKSRNTQMIVDPNLFRRYKITRVPAVITVSGLTGAGSCSEGNEEVVKIGTMKASFGDVPVRTHLEKLSEDGDPVAKHYLEAMNRESQ